MSTAECTVDCVPLCVHVLCALVCSWVSVNAHGCKKFVPDSMLMCMSVCVCLCVLLMRDCSAHGSGTLHCSVNELHRAARVRRSPSAAEQQQNKPSRELSSAQALQCNLLYLQSSFFYSSKGHTPLLPIPGPNKDCFTPVWSLSLIQCKQYWECLSMAGSPHSLLL